ncbi:MAG: methyl-accepting chemotaxis protein [Spirochaetales bacterium]|nr:methyl-accepting chemotaxis protein [Spirochaetales bacterium]
MHDTIHSLTVARRARYLRRVNIALIGFFLAAGLAKFIATRMLRFAVPVILLVGLIFCSLALVRRGRIFAAGNVTLFQIWLNVAAVSLLIPYAHYLELYRYLTYMSAYLILASLISLRVSQIMAAGISNIVLFNLAVWLKTVPGMRTGGALADAASLPGTFFSAYIAGNLLLIALPWVAATIWQFSMFLVLEADKQHRETTKRDDLIRTGAQEAEEGVRLSGDVVQVGECTLSSSQLILEYLVEADSTIEKTETAVNGVSERVEKIHTNVQRVDRHLTKTREQATEIVRRTISMDQNIDEIASEMTTLAETFRSRKARLPERERKVAHAAMRLQETLDGTETLAEAARVVSEIADRTHVLAMNALVVAARSGGSGSQFTVVAREVQNLATEVRRRTDDILAATKNAGASAADARSAIQDFQTLYDDYRHDLNESAEKILAFEERLGRIRGTVDEVGSAVRGLESQAAASREELRVTRELLGASQSSLDAMHDSFSTLTTNSATTRSTAEAVASMARSAVEVSTSSQQSISRLLHVIGTNGEA